MSLLPQHLHDLRNSGLSDATIAECGFYSEDHPTAIQVILNWKSPAKALGPCLCIPFFDPATGAKVNYTRVKPDKPRKQRGKEKVNKYESPVGRPSYPYVPPACAAALKNPKATIFITEGEKKSAKATQDGFPCIGLVGVYGFQKKRPKGIVSGDGARVLIDDLAAMQWAGREVFIVYDSDAAQNDKVLTAEFHLAETLKAVGATVKAVRLPSASDGSKLGFDDYLATHGADEFRKLLPDAVAPDRPGDDEPNDEPDDPHRLATEFLKTISAGNEPLLRSHRDEFYIWDGAHRPIPDGDVKAQVVEWTRKEFIRVNKQEVREWREAGEGKQPETRQVTTPLTANVIAAIRGMTLIPAGLNAPAWIDGAEGPNPAMILPVKNGLLDLAALAAGNPDCLLPATPHFFSNTVLPFEFDPDAPRPIEWLKFLSNLWPDDPSSIMSLQEWFGYLLTPDTSQQKILFMLGPRRSGKGTIARILQALLGEANYASPTLESLAGPFGLAPLLGRSVAIVSDARLGGRTDSAIIVERLLSISGEDALSVDRKFLPSVTAKLPTRFVILSNELPRFRDQSSALPGRLIIQRFTESWYGKEDPNLTKKLLVELPGILLWAIEGWRRLHARGRLAQPDAGKELVQEMEEIASPVGTFVKEHCIVQKGNQIEVRELFEAWKGWCESHGRKEAGTVETFGRDLRSVAPRLTKSRPRFGGSRLHVYEGIRLRTPSDSYPEDDDSVVELGHSGHSNGHCDQLSNTSPQVLTGLDTVIAGHSGHSENTYTHIREDKSEITKTVPKGVHNGAVAVTTVTTVTNSVSRDALTSVGALQENDASEGWLYVSRRLDLIRIHATNAPPVVRDTPSDSPPSTPSSLFYKLTPSVLVWFERVAERMESEFVAGRFPKDQFEQLVAGLVTMQAFANAWFAPDEYKAARAMANVDLPAEDASRAA